MKKFTDLYGKQEEKQEPEQKQRMVCISYDVKDSDKFPDYRDKILTFLWSCEVSEIRGIVASTIYFICDGEQDLNYWQEKLKDIASDIYYAIGEIYKNDENLFQYEISVDKDFDKRFQEDIIRVKANLNDMYKKWFLMN